jgi:hypothetical protein
MPLISLTLEMKDTNAVLLSSANPWPRMLTAREAARYLGFKTTKVLKGIPIKPKPLHFLGAPSRNLFDRHELDRWLDLLAGLTSTPQSEELSPYDSWKAGAHV